ncbi:MAG: MBL fold metallo-hydrolase [Phycisphaerales bacterium]
MQQIDLSHAIPDAPQGAALWAQALGPFETNCYVYTPDGQAAWIFDPGMDPQDVIEHVRQAGLSVEAIVLTHAHADHILGLDAVLEAFSGTPLLIHEDESEWLGDPAMNLSAGFGAPYSGPEPTRTLAHGDTLTIAGQPWAVRHTPGHSPGSCSFIAPGARLAIVGDTLFSGSIGRTDLPGGDFDVLADSIRSHLYTLDASCLCLPGHGPSTTVGHERQHNPFVRRDA